MLRVATMPGLTQLILMLSFCVASVYVVLHGSHSYQFQHRRGASDKGVNLCAPLSVKFDSDLTRLTAALIPQYWGIDAIGWMPTELPVATIQPPGLGFCRMK